MRNIYLILFSFITIHLTASEPLRMGVITDVHYLSKSLMDNGYTIKNYVYNSGKNVIAVPEVLDKVLDDYLNSDIEVLLVCGDLTKDGEKQSHLDLEGKLKPLYDKGIKIFVVPGNHDINMPNATKYQGNKVFKTENISPKEFEQIYNEYGFKNAAFRDESSLSYVSELNSSTWLLTIDAARYEEYKERPITAGRVKESTKEWIELVLNKARKNDKQVIAMMHWGTVEHIPFQASVFKDYLVNDYQNIATLLANNGVNCVFTGHFHSNDISKYTSKQGKSINDIETGSLVSYPFSYRFIELYKNKIDIKTKNITSIKSEPKLAEKNKEMMKRIAQKQALPMLKAKRFGFSDEHLKQIAEIASQLFVLHLYGDEKIDASIKQSLIDIFEDMDFPVDENLNNFSIDLPPSDNNLTIDFKH